VSGDTVNAQERLIAEIMQVQQRLAHIFAFDRSDPLLAANLTMPQLKVLFVLGLRGGASGQELTTAMGVSLATLTGIVDRLVAQDLVTRREDPRDRRVRIIELTSTGRGLIDGIMIAGAEHQRRLLTRLTADELVTVLSAVHLILGAANEEAAASADGDPEAAAIGG
jgi:DNA-binding MarR family transcriptional regulator